MIIVDTQYDVDRPNLHDVWLEILLCCQTLGFTERGATYEATNSSKGDDKKNSGKVIDRKIPTPFEVRISTVDSF